MYEKHWKLQEKPFRNTPDPRFFYLSREHEEALARLIYVVRDQMGAVILTGECGSGKTLLSRVLKTELLKEHYEPVIIYNPRLSPQDILREIIFQLDGKRPAAIAKGELLNQLNDILYKNKLEGKNTVIVIDEAQAIPSISIFEEFRLLLNFQLDNSFLLTLVLMGQPELKRKIDRLPQLKQRLAVRFHLTALKEEEVREYIRHRMGIAGAKEQVFLDDAFPEIYRFSHGIPRNINNICDLALLVAYGEGRSTVDGERIREVAEDLGEKPLNADDVNIDNIGVHLNG